MVTQQEEETLRLRSSLFQEHGFVHELSFREFLNTGSYKQNFVYVHKFVGRGPIHLIILLTCILCMSFRKLHNLHNPPQYKSQPYLSNIPGVKPI